MIYKYGTYPPEQFHEYKNKLHSMVHWLLIYAEKNNPDLNDYFKKIQYKFNGLNELIKYPPQLIEIMNLIEAAKIEYNSENYDHSVYRKIILDIHELIDRLPEEN